ncbi:hypothetical protein R8Z50_34030 [Longispora sp. K20-0274]|uniref:hypothetical protein n=1 Tax=Longispora sp. K20-0274 TaxID=3088255 RepID=UPI00399B67CA
MLWIQNRAVPDPRTEPAGFSALRARVWNAAVVDVRDELAAEILYLLRDLCVDLGFCLPPDEQLRLSVTPVRDVDAFTDAVFEAEGMEPSHHKQLRRTVRRTVESRIGVYLRPGIDLGNHGQRAGSRGVGKTVQPRVADGDRGRCRRNRKRI